MSSAPRGSCDGPRRSESWATRRNGGRMNLETNKTAVRSLPSATLCSTSHSLPKLCGGIHFSRRLSRKHLWSTGTCCSGSRRNRLTRTRCSSHRPHAAPVRPVVRESAASARSRGSQRAREAARRRCCPRRIHRSTSRRLRRRTRPRAGTAERGCQCAAPVRAPGECAPDPRHHGRPARRSPVKCRPAHDAILQMAS